MPGFLSGLAVQGRQCRLVELRSGSARLHTTSPCQNNFLPVHNQGQAPCNTLGHGMPRGSRERGGGCPAGAPGRHRFSGSWLAAPVWRRVPRPGSAVPAALPRHDRHDLCARMSCYTIPTSFLGFAEPEPRRALPEGEPGTPRGGGSPTRGARQGRRRGRPWHRRMATGFAISSDAGIVSWRISGQRAQVCQQLRRAAAAEQVVEQAQTPEGDLQCVCVWGWGGSFSSRRHDAARVAPGSVQLPRGSTACSPWNDWPW